ncbi:GspH/FimT family pseudopilin [uncultured Sphingomonas sp.]|uniref:GspH/FimT family pseudopilin n=1 Tax=uncultured Sphingomonas sp. TaxID=158754 RepID=UPI0035C9E0C1
MSGPMARTARKAARGSMPISAAGNRAAAFPQRGFTLVELMVVVTIIALASAAVVWAIPDPHGRVLDEATRFAARARAAHDEAIVGGKPVSLWATTAGYGFERRESGQWSAIADKPLRVERWSEGTRAAVGETSGRVRVVFDPTGLADRSADIRLDRRGAGAVVRIGADGSVRADAV